LEDSSESSNRAREGPGGGGDGVRVGEKSSQFPFSLRNRCTVRTGDAGACSGPLVLTSSFQVGAPREGSSVSVLG
jgi:hypothetical protein